MDCKNEEMEIQKGCFHEVSFVGQDGRRRKSKVPVVQELVRQGFNSVPERFLRMHPIPPAAVSSDDVSAGPPFINMANLLMIGSKEEIRVQELAKLGRGASEWGLFLVTNHGIPSSILQSVEDVVKGFFSLSFQEKKGSVESYASVDNVGYGRNFVKSDDQPLDWIDRLTMRASPKKDTEGIHVWPQKPVGFRQIMEKFVEEARKLCDELLQALAEALGLERHIFLQNFEPTESVVNIRINYYPPCPRPDRVLGIIPHTDASGLTLLFQFNSTPGGLEALKDKQWFKIPWPHDALLVNVGDLLEIMSNGRVKSSWHRVVTQVDKERISVALFYNPPLRCMLEPVRDQDSDKEGEGYKKVVVEDYQKHFYNISPTEDKQAISFGKV
ncbi:PREDICTED: protein SRG1-like [Nelumbo nucifera]|nr:PREDICTED: protein SRG1-like [Nelumbo nucifera]